MQPAGLLGSHPPPLGQHVPLRPHHQENIMGQAKDRVVGRACWETPQQCRGAGLGVDGILLLSPPTRTRCLCP